jgi:SPP1 gp7 family putative phage head morphogenesis protein
MPKAGSMIAGSRNRAERQYLHDLHAVIRKAETYVRGINDPDQISQTLESFFDSPYARRLFNNASTRMTTMLKTGQYNSWREAASASSHGKEIYFSLLREMQTAVGEKALEIVHNNSNLITTVQGDLKRRLSVVAAEGWQMGQRAEAIAKNMKKIIPQAAAKQIKVIARTETAKASTALVEARCGALGLDWYVWQTIGDERTRRSHVLMDGVLCRWSDPPNPERLAGAKHDYGPYHPGGIFNCRCVPTPIISPKDIEFPAQVHDSGSLRPCRTLAEFESQYA